MKQSIQNLKNLEKVQFRIHSQLMALKRRWRFIYEFEFQSVRWE